LTDWVGASKPKSKSESSPLPIVGRLTRGRLPGAMLLQVVLLCGLGPMEAPAVAAPGQPVQLQVSAEPPHPYVRARLRYRVRLLTEVPLRRPTLSDPEVQDAVIKPIGDDRQWTETRDGRRVKVWERTYLVIPQRTGELRITGPALTAAVPADTGDDAGDPSRSGLIDYLNPVHRKAPDLILDVRPPPAAAGTPWLPAEAVSISETWSPASEELHLGVPLTRRVRIEASGVPVRQLPEIPAPAGDGFKAYRGRSKETQTIDGGDYLATKSVEISYVPTAPGAWEVPALELPWWSLGMDEPRELRLPARRIRVVGGAAAGGEGADADLNRRFTDAAADDLWRGPWLTALLALGWLLTLAAWWRDRRRRPASGTVPAAAAPADGPPVALSGLLLRFERACRGNDARAARGALLDWGRSRWPERPPRGPLDLFTRLGADAAALEQARRLESVLYGGRDGNTAQWDGLSARAVLEPWLTGAGTPAADASASRLPPLYPPLSKTPARPAQSVHRRTRRSGSAG
jgi:hypothetical protein